MNHTGQTPVTVTIEGKSTVIPLCHLAAILTSHSLALHEWEKKAVAEAQEAISPYSLTTKEGALESSETALRNARDTIADVNQRRESVKAIEALFKA